MSAFYQRKRTTHAFPRTWGGDKVIHLNIMEYNNNRLGWASNYSVKKKQISESINNYIGRDPTLLYEYLIDNHLYWQHKLQFPNNLENKCIAGYVINTKKEYRKNFEINIISIISKYLIPQKPDPTKYKNNKDVFSVISKDGQFNGLKNVKSWRACMSLYDIDSYDCTIHPLTFRNDTMITPNIESIFYYDLNNMVCKCF